MANVIDGFRGHNYKRHRVLSVCPDDVYASWDAEIKSLSPKQRKKLKCLLLGVTVARKRSHLTRTVSIRNISISVSDVYPGPTARLSYPVDQALPMNNMKVSYKWMTIISGKFTMNRC